MYFLVIILYALTGVFIPGKVPATTAGATVEYSFVKGSNVYINCTTNVKSLHCVSDALFSRLVSCFSTDDSGVVRFKDTELTINVVSLDCGNKGINSDLCRILKAQEYPLITVRLEDARSLSGSSFHLGKGSHISADISITLAGRTRQETLQLLGKQEGPQSFHFIGEHKLRLTDFGIKPPTALFGMIRVQDTIHIQFNLLIRAKVVS